jgi:hypothetical protein
MKRTLAFFTILSITLISAQANTEGLTPEESLKVCYEYCMAYEEPGYALKKCISTCKEDYLEMAQENKSTFCGTFEEDCERDDDSDAWGGL